MLGFQFISICGQHAAPNTYVENLTSHLHALIRTHNFDFDIRFLPIRAHTSKNGATCCQQILLHRIQRSVLLTFVFITLKLSLLSSQCHPFLSHGTGNQPVFN